MVLEIETRYFTRRVSGIRVGKITERWVAHNIVLVKLDPSIRFDNAIYFSGKTTNTLTPWKRG
jgi:hypothetical protein